MRWSVVGGAVLAAGLSSAALADGMPSRPAAEAPFSWTGVYIGLNGGYSWGKADTRVTSTVTTPGVPPVIVLTALADGSAAVDGWIGGGQIGFNIQAQRLVFGLEADLQWSGERGRNAFPVATHEQPWFGTLRARSGVLVDPRFLLYATGGVAYSHFESNYVPVVIPAFSDTKNKGGWTMGGGAEWALHHNLSLKAEYLYIDYGTVGDGAANRAIRVGTDVIDVRTHLTDQVFRIGLNYRFGEREYVPLK